MGLTTEGQIKILQGALVNIETTFAPGTVTGWLVGDLFLRIKEVHGESALIEVGLRDIETKEPLAIQWTGWVHIGGKVEFMNDSGNEIFLVAQHITTIAK